jgi:hypothetical protein
MELSCLGLSFKVSEGLISPEYNLVQLRDASINETESYRLTADFNVAIPLTGANNFASCYRSCEHSDKVDCQSFSFCQYTDRIDCLVSHSSI